MDRYGFKDENTTYRPGKLLKELIDTGSHHSNLSGFNINDSIYSMFARENSDLGKAMLERRLKQHGLKLSNFSFNLDTESLKRDGTSIVDIKLDIVPLANAEKTSDDDTLRHPAAEQLSKLEAELAKAQKDDDEAATNGYKAALKMVVTKFC